MKIIEKLSEMIEEEIDGAYEYAKCAVKYKEEPDKIQLANTFYAISLQELSHITMLHEEVVKIINQYRNEHGAPPEGMQAIYDYLHDKHIEDVNDIKMMHSQFKN